MIIMDTIIIMAIVGMAMMMIATAFKLKYLCEMQTSQLINQSFPSGGDARSTNMTQNKEYTFEVFMCAAILMDHRDELAKCTDTGMVFTFINK